VFELACRRREDYDNLLEEGIDFAALPAMATK
jgi:hypothetical protein